MNVTMIRWGIRTILGLAFLWGFKKTYTYFTYQQAPMVTLTGLEPQKEYGQNVEAVLSVNNPVAIKFLQATLDGKPFDCNGKKVLGKKQIEHMFEIDTTLLEDGKHTFALKIIDGTYNKNSLNITVPFIVDNKILQASFLQDKYQIDQGKTARISFNTNKELAHASVTYLNKKYHCCKAKPHGTVYECFIPIECDQDPEEQSLLATLIDKTGKVLALNNEIQVKAVQFPVQKGFKVAPEKIQDEKDVSLSNDILSTALDKWLDHSPQEKLWKGAFDLPCQVTRFSTPFGEIRITPERGRYLHKAVDIVHNPRSVVWASARGKVIIKDRYLLSGNTVVIDHGMGVHSLYYHLHDFADIEVGDIVSKGAKIGRLGKTGYATGYHLHWAIHVNNVAVDPLEWTETKV